MGSANIFPRRLFVAIRREKTHVEVSKQIVESALLDADGVYRLLDTAAIGLSADEALVGLKHYGGTGQ